MQIRFKAIRTIYSRVSALGRFEVLRQLLQVTLKSLVLEVRHLFRDVRDKLGELLIYPGSPFAWP